MIVNKKSILEKLFDLFCFLCTKVHGILGRTFLVLRKVFDRFWLYFGWCERLAIMLSITTGIFISAALWLMPRMWLAAEWEKPAMDYFAKVGTYEHLQFLFSIQLYVGMAFIVAAFLAWVTQRIALFLIKIVTAIAFVSWVSLGYFIYSTSYSMLDKVENFDKYTHYDFITHWFLLIVPVALWLLVILLTLSLKSVNQFYKATKDGLNSDRLVKQLTTMGSDPRYRSSWLWSFSLHLSVIVVPLLFRGCMLEGYRIPKGDGAQPQVVKIKQIKKKKPEQFVFNPNSAISYYVPELNKKVLEELEEQTENQYKSQSLVGKNNNKSGKPGWPNGMDNAQVRFIRLKYSGGDWDQNMGKGADYNFLLEFKNMTGLNIASNTEAIEVLDLNRFPKKQKPPFVYITGKGGISMSAQDIKVLRTYLVEEGGMLFVDNGGGRFDQAVRSLIKRIFPDKNWVDIANDDILYQQPFLFPAGAPPLWHHSGTRALGIKDNNRWLVFYHQGDINDAWQTGGSGVNEATRIQSFKMGINIVNYAFNQYMSIHYGD